jgi:hypothetical protein
MGDGRHLGAFFAVTAAVVAQEGSFEQLQLRVASVRPNGAVVVDRGTRDLVQAGDHVVLEPRGGQPLQGKVIEIDDRTAVVELADRAAVVTVGTRGHVLVPKSRQAPPPTQFPVTRPQEQQPQQPQPPGEEEWKPGMPLLGTTRPPRPSERPRTLSGRVYTSAAAVHTLDTWSMSFLRTGTEAQVDNVDGSGGVFRAHGEFDLLTETSEETGADIRFFDLSYAHGGTRFEPFRWQVGRFLHNDMPEFGILDGIEAGWRREGGDRFGVSFGYLPELDEDMESFADLQIAAWYVWNQDVAERVQFAIGYQKSWHRLDVDRDLVVAKMRYLPLEGWDTWGSIWIDFYSDSDNVKNETVEITRANFFVNRRWEKSGGLELMYDHEEYPETLRRELPQTIQVNTLIDAHVDRASLLGYVHASDETRWFTRLTGWIDEEREGGAAELGIEYSGATKDHTRTAFALFDVQGLTSTVLGGRIEYGSNWSFGRLDMLYELGFVHHEGFPDDRDDLLQHRLAALWTAGMGDGWDATFGADTTLWDEEFSFGVSAYLQRLF